MPVAGKEYTKRIDLLDYPEEEQAYVVVISNPRAELWDGLDSNDNLQSRFELLSKLIKEWNFTDDEGNVLEITPENVRKSLSAIDLKIIIGTVISPATLSQEKKRTPSQTPVQPTGQPTNS